MLKKAPNTIINVRLQIQDSEKFLDIQIPQHTLIKQLESILAKQLKVNPFKIQFVMQCASSRGIINPASTLYQNSIKNNDIIYAKIVNIQTRSQAKSISTNGQSDLKNMTMLDIISGKPSQLELITKGLNLNVVCSNKKCFNYNKNTIIQLGLGTYNYGSIANSMKCPICPDKEINFSPYCLVKDFIFKECLWSLEGKIINKGIEVPFKQQQWVVVKTQDSTNFNTILNEHQWTNVNIVVKEIGRPKQKMPLLL